MSKVQLVILMMAAVLVPLVVLPESNFVDITSTPKTTLLRMLGTLQGGIIVSRLALAFTATENNRFAEALRSIRANRPVLAILGSIAAVTAVSTISTILSIIPHSSWWGRSPAGFEAGEFTFLMYVILSLSAFISLRELHDKSLLWKTLAVTGVLAALVGLFQFLGWSPLDISSTHKSKLTGTNGNPIFFGSMLILLAPITLGMLIVQYQKSSKESQNWWIAGIAATSFVLAVSLIATASRGPWVGAATAGLSAVILLASTGHLRKSALPISIISVFALIGALTVTFIDPTPPEPVVASDSTDSEENSPVSSALGDIGRTSTLGIRLSYWKMATETSTDRAPVPHTNDAPKVVRLLFGYGTDMFRYAGTYFSDSKTFTRRLTAAHNDPINRLFEQGFLGFLAWISLWVSIACASVLSIRRSLATNSEQTPWIPILIASALAGRFTEQLFGSPTPGDTLVFWLLVGGLASLLMSTPSPRAIPAKTSLLVQYSTYSAVAVIVIASVVLAWDRGASYLIANQMASFQYRTTVVEADEAIKRLEQAASLAPDVARYWHDLAEIEHGRAAATQNSQIREAALSRAYEYDLKAYSANPMEVNTIYKLAFSAWESGNAGRPKLRQKAVDLYVYLTEIFPSDSLAKERLQILTEFMSQ
ncbi:O-antigen ligase family protein [Candidatus Lucifugimonas marina]|uniref:O-antigen ligase-related domain-containing protein n=1 Tax=Candidatus Lucifugimonas marina TaxID=3038979 RepID=A0AAJ5ZCP0_9CHLR|nr:hypothetical protein [SAR202 cluster bacterium JH702]MDG0868238.1 hypothetical protein [SAR202 cluster bacterium JH639]WFG34882.1 hypothetical protein GKN94_04005 [SAR202 cluster bacterium JH545]WFG38833.1 hypothetical protein GKO48_04140 [SAR202 cluster bacterium JH1073]